MPPSEPKVWFITGAASGFGKAMVALALARGDSVVAADLRINPLDEVAARFPSDQFLVVRTDVTKPDDIKAAFTSAKNAFGRIDIVYNNAGRGVIGEVESVPEEIARAVMEVNFWGVVNVSKAAVRFFREENPKGSGGTLLQVSSMLGFEGCAALSYYSASKHAVEGYSQSLAAELLPEWNIKFVILESGWHRTDIIRETPRAPAHPAYQDPSSPAHLTRVAIDNLYNDPNIQDVDKASLAIYEFVQLEEKPLHFPLGKDTVQAVKRRIDTMKHTLEVCERFSNDLLKDRTAPASLKV
ncbi:hypothetical protein HYDPIDRAFT_40752 [Hydnomerulius pinastri MD-312]|uniref:NAD(P)-binding protein n=1 Tax=Hydnomerulius pinastri MD-312 TaxID=994086 RepID=A0A0C9WEQ0_9AGAM|nr:hypothetical protein HYDPIDRAFT_40752 [Hydnomerulius pinastri MD-312]